eukprot:scaffold251115_cov16-Prasinocladus_malaysianus.AAC.1
MDSMRVKRMLDYGKGGSDDKACSREWIHRHTGKTGRRPAWHFITTSISPAAQPLIVASSKVVAIHADYIICADKLRYPNGYVTPVIGKTVKTFLGGLERAWQAISGGLVLPAGAVNKSIKTAGQ